MKVKQEDFRFYRCSKNVENVGKGGRFQILPIFKQMWKMKVKQEAFRFYLW